MCSIVPVSWAYMTVDNVGEVCSIVSYNNRNYSKSYLINPYINQK